MGGWWCGSHREACWALTSSSFAKINTYVIFHLPPYALEKTSWQWKTHKKIFGKTALVTFSFIWDQDKWPGVSGSKNLSGFSGLLTVTMGYYLGNKEHTELFVGTVGITFSKLWPRWRKKLK